MKHPETQEMDIALHSLVFMLSNPALGEAQRDEIEDVMTQMMAQRDDIELELDDMEQDAAVGRIGWKTGDSPRSEEEEQRRQFRQMLRNARWN